MARPKIAATAGGVSDDPKPRNPRIREPGYVPPKARIAAIRRMLIAGASEASVIEWCETINPGTPDGKVPAKAWFCSEGKARDLIRQAKEQTYGEDIEDRASKKAVNRARVLAMVARALERDDLHSAIRAQHMLNLIDRSYDDTHDVPNMGQISDEESIRTIDHAARTLALARQRGSLPAAKPAIDVESMPADEDNEDGAAADAGEN